jgi:hypothetical protein
VLQGGGALGAYGMSTPVAAIHARCLDGVGSAALQPTHFDGKSL